MSMEQQKKTERLVNYLEDDLNTFYQLIDTSIYYFNWRDKKKKKNEVMFSKEYKQEVVKQAKELNQSLNRLTEAFKSIYFVYGADDASKKYFESFKILNSTLDNINDEFGYGYLFDIHNQTSEGLDNLRHVKSLVLVARIANSEEIKKRAKDMSVWQWLFGY